MTDILKYLETTADEVNKGYRNILAGEELYTLLHGSIAEIKRLRQANSDMSWKLNPDRMGGQFTEWEMNRRGDEWS